MQYLSDQYLMFMFKLPNNDLYVTYSICHVCHKLTVTHVTAFDVVLFFCPLWLLKKNYQPS